MGYNTLIKIFVWQPLTNIISRCDYYQKKKKKRKGYFQQIFEIIIFVF